MIVELRKLNEVGDSDLQSLFNDESVKKYMPLAEAGVTLEWVRDWVQVKSKLWGSNELGPWGVYLNGRFAGWSGLQPDGEACELAVVLHKWAWGAGHEVASQTLAKWREFGMSLPIYIYLPVNRRPHIVANRLGLKFAKNFTWSGHEFVQFELLEPRVNVQPLEEEVDDGEVKQDRNESD